MTAPQVVELSNGSMMCSMSNEFESAVWKILEQDNNGGTHCSSVYVQRLPAAIILITRVDSFAGFDYLVMECSGVTDPVEIIETMERQYGKMTRYHSDHSLFCHSLKRGAHTHMNRLLA